MKNSREPVDIASGGITRGLLWRVKLGVLPSGSPSIEELRRAAADGRRRYAELRRRLLVNPHVVEEPHKPYHHSFMDNPLSLDPESIWGLYFQNVELERTIDKDLSRLYPEHGNFFQSHVYQPMLRRILVVWSLLHPHFSYQQGMHELLAPLLYVLHHDVVNLSEMKHRHTDLFYDRFDEPYLLEPWLLESGVKQKNQSFYSNILTTGASNKNEECLEKIAPQGSYLIEPDEFGFDLGIMVSGSDTYGAEGELGVLLSGKFIEHDAYSMLDALMSGKGGTVYMADYFLIANVAGSTTGVSPVLEASATIYRALAAADLSLYNHLLGLGVEPQFFSLRWLRVLFGREFNLGKLLLLWDAIFSVASISESLAGREGDSSSSQPSPRRAFILALAVSMLLYLGPTLLTSPSLTGCLQKLLNFPENADVSALIDSAQTLKPLVEEVARIVPSQAGKFIYTCESGKITNSVHNKSRSPFLHAHGVLSTSKLLQPWNASRSRWLSESYWEEKWKSSILKKSVTGNGDEARQKTVCAASAICVQDLADSSADSKEKGDGSLSVAELHSNTGSDFECMVHNISKTVKRKLHDGLNGVAHSFRTKAEGTVTSGYLDHMERHTSNSTGLYGIGQTLQASIISQDINDFQGKCNLVLCGDLELRDGDFKGRGKPETKTISPDNRNQQKSKDKLSENGSSAPVKDYKMMDTIHETIQSTLSTNFLVGEKVLARQVAEEPECAHAVVNENVPIDMKSKVWSSTQLVPLTFPLGSEGTEGISEMLLSVPQPNILPSGSQPRKKFWIWNRCKTDSGDKVRGSVQLKDHEKQSNTAVTPENSGLGRLFESQKEVLVSKDVITNGDSVLTNAPVRELCSFTCSSLADTQTDGKMDVCPKTGLSEFTLKSRSAKEGQVSSLRSLGLCIADNIQVIEAALSLMATHENKEHLLVISGEKRGKVLAGGMGHKAGQAALAELRKTSCTLLQMEI